MLGSQLLRHRLEKVVRRDRVEEDLAKNDVEVVVDEVLEVDVPQLSKTMSKRKMKLAKSMSMLEVDATNRHEEGMDLVVERCEEEVVQKMVMCRCGCGVESLTMDSRGDLDGTRALLPC